MAQQKAKKTQSIYPTPILKAIEKKAGPEPWANFGERLGEALSKLRMLQESMKAWRYASMGENINADFFWFEGAEIVCNEIQEVVQEAVDFVDMHTRDREE